MRLAAALLFGALAFVAACGGTAAPVPTPPPGAVVITAFGTAFVEQQIGAPAGAGFTLFFENRDGQDHNVHIWAASGASVLQGEIFSGPAARTESVPALAPGHYRLTCDIHPGMTAELVVH